MSQYAIEVNGVTKIFGSNTAVNNINLKIGEGEFFSFLGPSGCGKTTLLRMIAGFETPSVGEILIAGQDMSNVPPHKRPVNMVFQNYALFPHLSVADNVCFGLKSKGGLSQAQMLEKATEALSLVRLAHLAGRYPSQLSGGQQQRVALARAVVNHPRVLLLDEPLSALDPQIRDEMQDELAQLQRELNMTFVMVTHDQCEALALSNRIAVFCAGNLEQVGSPQAIYEEPKTTFVAKFIGNTNLVQGKLIDRQESFARIESSSGHILIAAINDDNRTIENGALVTVWIKPQSMLMQKHGTEGETTVTTNRLEAIVLNRSYQGTATEYLLRVFDTFDLRAYAANKESNSMAGAFEVGERVALSVPASLCSFLPREAAAVATSSGVIADAAQKTTVQAAT